MKKTWLVHKGNKTGTFKFNQYNEVKQDWKQKVVTTVRNVGFTAVDACYFNYLVVENTRKRDPSNIISSSIKFIEDGLSEAGVIPNDGWNNVLGITNYFTHQTTHEEGVFLVMTDVMLMPCTMMELYGQSKR